MVRFGEGGATSEALVIGDRLCLGVELEIADLPPIDCCGDPVAVERMSFSGRDIDTRNAVLLLTELSDDIDDLLLWHTLRESPRESPRDSPRRSPRDSPRDFSRDSPRES